MIKQITLGNHKLTLERTRRSASRLGTCRETHNDYAATCNMLWALQQKRNVTNTPEDIADILEGASPEEQQAAMESIAEILGVDVEGEPQAKPSATSPQQSSIAESSPATTGD